MSTCNLASSSSGPKHDPDVHGQFTSFCKAYGPGRRCPTPPTVPAVDIQAYTGLWYEIGVTAGFKIESELGSRCVTANYTANGTAPYVRTPIDFSTIPFGSLPAMAPPPSGHSSTPTAPDGLLDEESTPTESERIEQLGFNLSALVPPPEGVGKAVKVLNRGENVTSPVVLEAVVKISVITSKVLSSLATTTCPLVSSESAQRIKSAATEEGSRSAQAIARSADGILQSIAQIVEAAMEVVHGVESITFGIGEVNQGHYDKAVKRQIASGSSVVNKAAREISRQANNVKRNVNKILKLASSLSDTTVAKTVIQETQKISSLILTTMSAGVEIKEAAETIRKENRFISKQGILRPGGIAVTGIRGQAVQNPKEPGKITVNFGGFPGAYWLIALEGEPAEGYEVAVIYGCQDLPPFLQSLRRQDDSVFIIARKREIPEATVNRLLAFAKGLGINTSGDNVFIRGNSRDCTGRTFSTAA
ncbi:hypothetical protein CBR_g20112 [Chara braunii]|uniref:Lipocalin/cytosolic fatty-acid binding domain-containing protein n=1 Tax=Chara braunii TaxID=69332 RepID=A0A388KZM1_CHABU|nr:hypothetical protein CBR_g20112 [Chara braunii]|eukprot:GBG75481.1 hypothetical protein CBR_g20112 [Chara braunii]